MLLVLGDIALAPLIAKIQDGTAPAPSRPQWSSRSIARAIHLLMGVMERETGGCEGLCPERAIVG